MEKLSYCGWGGGIWSPPNGLFHHFWKSRQEKQNSALWPLPKGRDCSWHVVHNTLGDPLFGEEKEHLDELILVCPPRSEMSNDLSAGSIHREHGHKVPGKEQRSTDSICFLGPNYAEPRTRVEAPQIPRWEAGKEETRKRGKEEKGCALCRYIATHSAPTSSGIFCPQEEVAWLGQALRHDALAPSFRSSPQLTPLSQLPFCDTSPHVALLPCWVRTSCVPDEHPSCGSNRSQTSPQINVVGGRGRGSTMRFGLCHPPRVGTRPEGYIPLPSGPFPEFF